MRALLDDASMIHDEHTAAREHGGEPVGDDKCRAPPHQVRERGLDRGLALGIKRRGRLVEQEKRRVAQNSAGDGDPLALAAREHNAALADRRVESLRQRGNKSSRMGVLGGPHDIGIGSVRAAEADVVARRGGEHHAVLRHQRDAGTQLSRIEVHEPHAVERDIAGGAIVEAQ